MKPRYRFTQILGVLICVLGLGLLVASDSITDKDYAAVNMALGDGFMILGASLYGFSACFSPLINPELDLMTLTSPANSIANATEEFFVRKRPLLIVIRIKTYKKLDLLD